MTLTCNYGLGVVGVWWRCRVSYVTWASNWYWLPIGQGLLSLKQVRVEGERFYFFCFFTFIPIPLPSPMSLSFIFSTVSSISFLPFSGMTQNDPQWLTCHLTPAQSINETMDVFHFSKNHSCKLERYSVKYFSLLFKVISPGNPFCTSRKHTYIILTHLNPTFI